MLDTKTMLKLADSLNRKDKGINVQVIMLKVSFFTGLTYTLLSCLFLEKSAF